MKYDYLIFIGRFQPYHSGHHYVAQEALKISKNLIYVIGSHDRPRCIRNPFNTPERIDIIKAAFDTVEFDGRIHFAPQVDHTYNDEKWIASIQAMIGSVVYRSFDSGKFLTNTPKIGVIGYNKDHSSYYLKKFPQYEFVEILPKNECNATDLRRILFAGDDNEDSLKQFLINPEHMKRIYRFSNLSEIMEEWREIEDYKKSWAGTPYPSTFVTVDAVVTQSGHILVVTRGESPGKGLWALPGGFVNPHETLQETALRELEEETKIAVSIPALVGSIVKTHTFDDPHRSVRGRTITSAYHFKLNDQTELPKVVGSDDARKAEWITLGEAMSARSRFFEDHYCIIERMMGL